MMSQLPRKKKRKIESIQSQALAIITKDYMECMKHSWKDSPIKNKTNSQLLEIIKATDPKDYLQYPDEVNLSISSALKLYHHAFSTRLEEIQISNEQYLNDVMSDFFLEALKTIQDFEDSIIKLAFLICSIKSIEKVFEERNSSFSSLFFNDVLKSNYSFEAFLAIITCCKQLDDIIKVHSKKILMEFISACKNGKNRVEIINKMLKEILKSKSNSAKDFINLLIKSYVENLESIQVNSEKVFENINTNDMVLLMNGFVTYSFTSGDTFNINDAIKMQTTWTKDALNGEQPLWLSVCRHIDFEHVLSCIENATKCSSNLNWRRVLYIFQLKNFQTEKQTITSITKSFYKFIENLITNSFKDQDIRKNLSKGLKVALFLVRHVSCLQADGILVYSSWFENLFGSSGKILKTHSILQCFTKTLIDLIPYEDPFYLKVHIIKKQTRAGDIYIEYKEFAHARLNEINEPIPKTGVILVQPGKKSKISEKAKAMLENALDHFESTGKISDQVMQASVFSAPFYANEFITALLELGSISTRSLRTNFIYKLHKAGKLEAHFVEKYENACSEEEQIKLRNVINNQNENLSGKLHEIEKKFLESQSKSIDDVKNSFKVYIECIKLLIEKESEKDHSEIFNRFIISLSKISQDIYDTVCDLFMAKTVYKDTVASFMKWIVSIVSKTESSFDSSTRRVIGIFINIILSQPEICSEEFHGSFFTPIISIDRCLFILDILNSCFEISIENTGKLNSLFYWLCIRLKQSHSNLISKYKLIRKSITKSLEIQQWIEYECLIEKEIMLDEELSVYLNLILPSLGNLENVFQQVFLGVITRRKMPKRHMIFILQNTFLRLLINKKNNLGSTNMPFFIDFFDSILKKLFSFSFSNEEIFLPALDLLLLIISPEWLTNSRINGIQVKIISNELLKRFFQNIIKQRGSIGLDLKIMHYILKSPDSMEMIEHCKILKFSVIARGLFHYINIEHWLYEDWCSTAISYFDNEYLSTPLWLTLFFLDYIKLTIDGNLKTKLNASKIQMGIDCIDHSLSFFQIKETEVILRADFFYEFVHPSLPNLLPFCILHFVQNNISMPSEKVICSCLCCFVLISNGDVNFSSTDASSIEAIESYESFLLRLLNSNFTNEDLRLLCKKVVSFLKFNSLLKCKLDRANF